MKLPKSTSTKLDELLKKENPTGGIGQRHSDLRMVLRWLPYMWFERRVRWDD